MSEFFRVLLLSDKSQHVVINYVKSAVVESLSAQL